MALNQVEVGYTNELPGQDQEAIVIPSRAKEMVLKAGLGLTLILAMAFIALPVVSLFIKSPLDATLEVIVGPDGSGRPQAKLDNLNSDHINCGI